MTLKVLWSEPSPAPTCGYKVEYRRKADPAYTVLETVSDVPTSGVTVTVLAPACYEGSIISNCCNEELGIAVPFGANAYSPFTVALTETVSNQVQVTITSGYGNPYDTIITGSYHIVNGLSTASGTFEVTYPAGSTTHSTVLSGFIPGGSTLNNITITGYAPVFDNDGQLQKLDSVSTPPYFKFYPIGDTSGTTWNGAPTSLPSFTLDRFVSSEVAKDGTTVLAGNLYLSYILDQVFDNDFNNLTIEVYDSTNALLGSYISLKSPLGLREEYIALTKGTDPLDETTEFTMKVLWPDDTLVESKIFYLP